MPRRAAPRQRCSTGRIGARLAPRYRHLQRRELDDKRWTLGAGGHRAFDLRRRVSKAGGVDSSGSGKRSSSGSSGITSLRLYSKTS
jgi:hypothetical protein